jgi:anti-sigma-K factor RskA
MGLTNAATPPPHLRQAVLSRIHAERQSTRRRGPALATRLVAAAAAVLLVVAVSLGVALVTGRHDLEQAQHQNTMLATVLRAGDAHVAHAGEITVIVSPAQNRGVLLADLPPAPDGHTYQAWTVDSRYHSAGTFAGPAMTELTGIATADRVAVTVEPAGGSTQPTTAPVAETAIP